MNHMKQVLCPIAGVFWANSCKARKGPGGYVYDYRCCKCGQTGHSVVKERN